MKRSRFVLHLKCAKLASAANCLTGEESLVRALTEGKDQLTAGPLQVHKVKPSYRWKSIHLSVRSIAQHAFDLLHKLTWMKRLGQIQVSASLATNGHTPKCDTGKGIAPEFLPHIFDQFRQEEESHSRSYGGLGLGLYIVRELVELHGGTIQAESDGAGKGATFRVRLPSASPQ